MAWLYREEKQLPEASKEYDIILKRPDANAFDWHNAAIMLYDQKDYEKCIEYEKKALALSDFGPARTELSNALSVQGNETFRAVRPQAKNVTDFDPAEARLRESLKWNPTNKQALGILASISYNRFLLTRDQRQLEIGREFVDKILASNPDDKVAMRYIQVFEDAKNGKVPSNRVPASEEH